MWWLGTTALASFLGPVPSRKVPRAALRCSSSAEGPAEPDLSAWRNIRWQMCRSWEGEEAGGDEGWAHTLPLPETGCLLLAKPNVRFVNDPAKMLSAVLVLSHSSTAGTVGLALNRPTLEGVVRHPNRQFADFASFWPLYLSQHSKPLTKLLHAIGTTFALISLVPGHGVRILLRLALGIATAVSLSLCGVDSFASHRTGLPEALVMVVLLLTVCHLYTGLPAKRVALQLASGYLLAWIAHFFVEHKMFEI